MPQPMMPPLVLQQAPPPQPQYQDMMSGPSFLMNICIVLTAAVVAMAFLVGYTSAQVSALRSIVEANHSAMFAHSFSLGTNGSSSIPKRRTSG